MHIMRNINSHLGISRLAQLFTIIVYATFDQFCLELNCMIVHILINFNSHAAVFCPKCN